MNLHITVLPDDDTNFVRGLTHLIAESIHQYAPADVVLVRTDNWFDVKWFTFSGNVSVGAEPREVRHIWQVDSEVTVPPFAPGRILEERHLCCGDGVLSPAGDDIRFIHPAKKERSARNLSNRLLDHSPSGLFTWFSSKSQSNGRASVMVYSTHTGNVDGWYASFLRDGDWRIDRTRNADRNRIEQWFQLPVDHSTAPDRGSASDMPPPA